jgi:hypothetical protein
VFVKEVAGHEVGGCGGLISSGTSAQESGFLDASATGGRDAEGHEGGGDVFFFTASRLVPSQDYDESRDVYDAHECSTSAPCFPPVAEQPPRCAKADTCRAAPAAQPSIFGPPASATFSGPGNATPEPGAPRKGKTAAQVRAEKLARALRGCRTKHNRRKRTACERDARRQYGAKKASRHKRR